MSSDLMAGLGRDVEQYAALRAQLSAAGEERDALLAAHGLDEERWELIDDAWQQRLSAAMERPGDGVPLLLQRFAEAFARAQRDTPGRVLTLEQFARCTRAVQGARDPGRALAKQGVSLAEYLRANQHWSPQLATDAALALQFQAAMRRGSSG